MMIHNYDSITNENDRKAYKEEIDDYFGHGSAKTIVEKRQAMHLAHSRVAEDCVSQWFPNPDEQDFFISCMNLIAEHDREEERAVKWKKPVKGEIDDNNPALWRRINTKKDEDTDGKSRTPPPGKGTSAVQKPVAGSRQRPPVITYETVVSLLVGSIDELE